MAKASRPGNQAVAGIAGTSTTSPTFTKKDAAGSAAGSTGKSSSSGTGSSSNKSSTSNKSSSSTSVKNSYSNSTKTGTGNSGSSVLPGEVRTVISFMPLWRQGYRMGLMQVSLSQRKGGRMRRRVWLPEQKQTSCPAMWRRLTMWISLSRKPNWRREKIRKRGELCWPPITLLQRV